MSLYRIGVDVGGTNTDAAILDIRAANEPGRGVLASHKASTTADITSGIEAAIAAVLKASQVDKRRVLSVTIGTTHFINALIEADARRLERVAVIRLCGPFTRQIPPFSGFPLGLHGVLDGGTYYLDGGLEMDGRPIAPLDEEQVRRTARDIVAAKVGAVAVIGIFSPLDHDGIYEKACKQILLDVAPNLRVVCSQNIGPTGLLERENATILNAAILKTGQKVKNGFKRAIKRLSLNCALYLSQNDGTLLDAETAADFPIKTFASGPTNSMSGAAFLAGLDRLNETGRSEESTAKSLMTLNGWPSPHDAERGAPRENGVEPQLLVVDIGGTTTDVCALLPSGFPRQAPGFVEIAGVRTAFSIPEVVSIGLGGGSRVQVHPASSNNVLVGPSSVGHELLTHSKVFGGQILTATDVVVAEGKVLLGSRELVRDISPETREASRREINNLLATIVEKIKVSTAPVHAILVGGGAILAADGIPGVDKCIQPMHQGAANAVGAAIGKVAGEVDTVEILEGKHEGDVIKAACQRAIDQAVAKGAQPDDVRIVEVNKMPLQYMSQVTMRIQVRAVGRLAIPEDFSAVLPSASNEDVGKEEEEEENEHLGVPLASQPTTKPSLDIDIPTYRPDVRNGVWYPSDVDLEFLSTGCAILGTGGGGPTYYEYLKSLRALKAYESGRMRIVPPSLLKDDAIICLGSWYGSPSVINERLAAGNEIIDAINAVNKILRIDSFDAVLADEIGGGNGLSALPVGAHFDVPIVDADGMGRAYPTIYHLTFSVHGHQACPVVITDARNNAFVAWNADGDTRLEAACRTAAIELGLSCASGMNPISGATAKKYTVQNTVSQSWYLGRAVHSARRTKTSFTDGIFDVCAGKVLFTGKIVDVQRHLDGGYTMGAVVLAPFTKEEREAEAASLHSNNTGEKHMILPFQNEFLYAALCDKTGSEASQEVVATVPDLISVLGHDGEAIGSQDVRFGLRATVIVLPSSPLWKSDKGMAVGGPAGFGLKMAPVDCGIPYTEPRSVIDEFGRAD